MAAGAHDRAEWFDAEVRSVRAARMFMRQALADFDVPEPPLKNAVLLGNELVTNAVQHAQTRFEVRLSVNELHVRVEVRDSDPHTPRKQDAGATDTSGRGLAMVDLVADSWGVDEDAAGKAVWAELLV